MRNYRAHSCVTEWQIESTHFPAEWLMVDLILVVFFSKCKGKFLFVQLKFEFTLNLHKISKKNLIRVICESKGYHRFFCSYDKFPPLPCTHISSHKLELRQRLDILGHVLRGALFSNVDLSRGYADRVTRSHKLLQVPKNSLRLFFQFTEISLKYTKPNEG